jgi:hypothetical protein
MLPILTSGMGNSRKKSGRRLVESYERMLKFYGRSCLPYGPFCKTHQNQEDPIMTRGDLIPGPFRCLVKGDVFTTEVIKTYLDYKRAHEIDEIRMRPHPYEFILYYDV